MGKAWKTRLLSLLQTVRTHHPKNIDFYFIFFLCIVFDVFFLFDITCNFIFFTGIEFSIIFIENDGDRSERDEDRDGGSESGKERGSDRGSVSNMEGMPEKEEEEVSLPMSMFLVCGPMFIFTLLFIF